MGLTLNKTPKFKKRKDLSSNEKDKAFSDFCKHSKAYHDLKMFTKKRKEENPFNWKDELIAIIPKKDYDRFADGVAFCTGSELEILEGKNIGINNYLVYASGYYRNIGA